MKKQNIEDIFSSMENFSSVPPPELWANIEEKLDKPKKKKRAILWWAAAACLLLGLSLPSVLNKSNNGIKTINNGSGINNSVVIEEKKNGAKDAETISTEKSNTINKSDSIENSSLTGPKNTFDSAAKNQIKATAVADADSDSKSDINSGFNTKLNSAKRNTNQAVATKTSISKYNSFHSTEKNQFSETEKRNADKVLAGKTFNAGKQNQFNSFSRNQTPNSIFGNQLNSNANNIALGNSNSILNQKQTTGNANQQTVLTGNTKTEKSIAANNNKSNSKFNDVLSKQDSVQLAELQNLEKGITPELKKEKDNDPKTNSKSEKWALEVFAGIANSENYKNDKTLGNVNDSKQSSTYGVKTKYKINKKWAVGSGFKINELGQSVANVSYIKTAGNAFLSTGDYFMKNPSVPQIASNDGYVLVSNTTKNALTSNNVQSGNLDQSLRYVEMPLEVSYAVFSKNKASISLNTGGFVGKLISNNVAIDGNSLGKNINANDFVYGSTLSSTVQYRVYKKTNVFVEPAMNYYINPLNNQSFNQFQWGLNFGLNVSF